MRFMILIKATKDSEAGRMPGAELLEAMGRYNEELIRAGVLLAGDGLQPSSKGARVRFSGKTRTIVDGPFPATKELVAGYWILQLKSLDEAKEWARRIPNPTGEEGEVEIRQLFDIADFDYAPKEVTDRFEEMSGRIGGGR